MRKLSEAPEFQIRVMTAEDLPVVQDIEARAFKHPWSPELLRRELTHEWSVILLAEEETPDGTRVLGFLICWVVHDELHILNVATDPAHRNRGVARAVLTAALAHARQKKCALATLEVRKSNETALHLYKDFNFRPVGVRPNYYVDEREDAIVMVLDL